MVTNEMIKSLNPCQDRLDNYLKFYENKTHTRRQFMGLKNITHEDKLWVALRLMPKQNIKLAAADIAESVLHIFESRYPDYKRTRLIIEAARSGVSPGERDAAWATSTTAYYADADAAYYADADAAYYAATWASSAANPAVYTVYAANTAATWAAEAVYYAAWASSAASYAANPAAYTAKGISAASNAGIDKLGQEKLIRKIILKYWR